MNVLFALQKPNGGFRRLFKAHVRKNGGFSASSKWQGSLELGLCRAAARTLAGDPRAVSVDAAFGRVYVKAVNLDTGPC